MGGGTGVRIRDCAPTEAVGGDATGNRWVRVTCMRVGRGTPRQRLVDTIDPMFENAAERTQDDTVRLVSRCDNRLTQRWELSMSVKRGEIRRTTLAERVTIPPGPSPVICAAVHRSCRICVQWACSPIGAAPVAASRRASVRICAISRLSGTQELPALPC